MRITNTLMKIHWKSGIEIENPPKSSTVVTDGQLSYGITTTKKSERKKSLKTTTVTDPHIINISSDQLKQPTLYYLSSYICLH